MGWGGIEGGILEVYVYFWKLGGRGLFGEGPSRDPQQLFPKIGGSCFWVLIRRTLLFRVHIRCPCLFLETPKSRAPDPLLSCHHLPRLVCPMRELKTRASTLVHLLLGMQPIDTSIGKTRKLKALPRALSHCSQPRDHPSMGVSRKWGSYFGVLL